MSVLDNGLVDFYIQNDVLPAEIFYVSRLRHVKRGPAFGGQHFLQSRTVYTQAGISRIGSGFFLDPRFGSGFWDIPTQLGRDFTLRYR